MAPAQPLADFDLHSVQVRPTHGSAEHRRWDQLVARHHYLSFRSLFGRGLRHVATLGQEWIALLGWQAGALKVSVRDRWIGWSNAQKLRRLHLIAQNVRFLILLEQRRKNLASRVLGLSLRRLSADMLAEHGYPVLLAETFCESPRFRGTCYRAANWRHLGRTGGFARQPGPTPRWRHHGQPKEVYVYELQPDARARLSQPADEPHWRGPPKQSPPPSCELRSLHDFLGEVPEFRSAHGKRYPLSTVLAMAVSARMAGYRGVTAFGQYARLLSQEQLASLGCFYSPSRQCYTPPSTTTFHRILSDLPPDTLQDALSAWGEQLSAAPEPLPQPAAPSVPAVLAPVAGVAMDGKDIRGASKQTEQGRRMMVAAVQQGSGHVLGQVETESKSNEIPAVRRLARSLRLAGKVVTMDALHAQHKTARCLLQECAADYLMTAVKANQPTILDELKDRDFSAGPHVETLEKSHGRIDRRRYSVKDLSAAEWDGYAHLHGRQMAVRVERERTLVKSGETSFEVSYALTSLSPERAAPRQLAALIRGHWEIENRLHYVRDFTYDEDRCRAYVRKLPQNLAALTNAAVSMVRCRTSFRYLPVANRHFAARTDEAFQLILTPQQRH